MEEYSPAVLLVAVVLLVLGHVALVIFLVVRLRVIVFERLVAGIGSKI